MTAKGNQNFSIPSFRHVAPWCVSSIRFEARFDRLIGDRYLSGKVVKMMTDGDARPWFIEGVSIAERGARTIGMWPSDDIFGDFLKYLDSTIKRHEMRP